MSQVTITIREFRGKPSCGGIAVEEGVRLNPGETLEVEANHPILAMDDYVKVVPANDAETWEAPPADPTAEKVVTIADFSEIVGEMASAEEPGADWWTADGRPNVGEVNVRLNEKGFPDISARERDRLWSEVSPD